MRDLTEATATFHPIPPQDDKTAPEKDDKTGPEEDKAEAGPAGEAKKGVRLLLLTSHLESCKTGSAER